METNDKTQEIKLCPSCGAKNKAVYSYCNECGAPLTGQTAGTTQFSAAPGQSAGFTAPVYVPQQPVIQPTPAVQPAVPVYTQSTPTDFDGITPADLYAYTGSDDKLYEKMRQLYEQKQKGKKLWCLPLFLLGLFFGSFGMACWHLYHRLYKRATALFCLTAVEWTVGLLIAHQMLNGVMNTLPDLLRFSESTYAPSYEYMMEMYRQMFGGLSPYALIASTLLSILQLALVIILPFFAYRASYQTAVARSHKADEKNPTPALQKLGAANPVPTVIVSVAAFILYTAAMAGIIIPFFREMFAIMMEITL